MQKTQATTNLAFICKMAKRPTIATLTLSKITHCCKCASFLSVQIAPLVRETDRCNSHSLTVAMGTIFLLTIAILATLFRTVAMRGSCDVVSDRRNAPVLQTVQFLTIAVVSRSSSAPVSTCFEARRNRCCAHRCRCEAC